ncbi:MAG: shikimate kinase, partial [Bacteroidota bacterium]
MGVSGTGKSTIGKLLSEKLDVLFKDHDIAILVGGSGLYVDAVVQGMDAFPDIDPTIREELNAV